MFFKSLRRFLGSTISALLIITTFGANEVYAAVPGSATPTFSPPVSTATGFTLNVTNYNATYTYTATATNSATVTKGTASGSTLPWTVTGLTQGQSATVTVTVSDGSAGTRSATSSSGTAGLALTPTLSAAVATATGFTFNVTNYDVNYTFTPTVTAGSVANGTATGATLPVTVTGLDPGQSATVTMTVTRSGFATGSATRSGTALTGAALTPTLSAAVSVNNGFYFDISNYDANYTFTPTISSFTGTTTPTVSTGPADLNRLPVTVTGLSPGGTAIVLVTVTRTGYSTGSASRSGSALNGAALNPTFDSPVSTSGGFTVNITNYDANYTFSAATSSGTVTQGTASGATLPLTVTGVVGGQTATVTVTVTRTGYDTGTAQVTGLAESAPALTPTFSSSPTFSSEGFTLQITNYNSAFTWDGTNSAGGTVTISSTGLITVTGLASGTSSTVTVTTTRTGYNDGSATSSPITFYSQVAPTPIFGTSTQIADGFTLQIDNYDSAFDWNGTNSLGGSVTIDSTGLITVTGLNPGTSSTVTVYVTRDGYNPASATSSSIASLTGSALTSTFSTPVSTNGGFTVNVTNYDASYTFTATTSAGTVTKGTASGSTLPLTVTGLTVGQSATVTVSVARTGYNTGSGTVTGSANLAALTPTFSTPVSTNGGFTVNVTNYDANYTFTPSTSSGTVTAGTASGSTLPLTVTGLSAGASATVTVSVIRTGYNNGSATVTGSALLAALTPTFSTPVSTVDGFTVNVTNYSASYTFTPTTSAGTVTKGTASGSTLPLTVTGLTVGQSATVTVSVARTGYNTGSGTVTGSANLAALTPTFSTPVSTNGGFTVNVTNYDASYTFTATTSAGTVTKGTASGSTLPLTVTGLTVGQSATVTVSVARTGYNTGSGTVTGSANLAALTPTFSTPVSTNGGFTVNVTNYDANYTFTPSTSSGTVTAGTASGSTLPLTVTGLSAGASATVTVSVIRTGYNNGSATVTGSAFQPALDPVFSTITSTTTGFTVNVNNYNASFTYAATSSVGTVTIGAAFGRSPGNTPTLPLTVTGLEPGQSATLTVSVTRTGYLDGSGSITGIATFGAALTPTLSAATSTVDGFTLDVTNYKTNNLSYTFTPTTTAGTLASTVLSNGNLQITISGLAPGAPATVTVTTTRTGYLTGTASTTGKATNGAALTPTLSTPVRTADGFTVNVTNYNVDFTFTPTTTAGTVTSGTASGTTLPITLIGLNPGEPATVTITVTRTGYDTGTRTTSSNALSLTPTFSTPVSTADGYTVNVTNYDANYLFTPTTSAGSVTEGTPDGTTLPITITGLAPGASATLTVITTRTSYTSGTATVTGKAINGVALTPTFGSVTQTTTGFTFNVTNYDANYTFTPTTTAGSVTSGTPDGTDLPVTVTGLNPGQPATITVTVTRTGYDNGTATVSDFALPFTPTFSSLVRTADGFTVNVDNYDSNYTFTATVSPDTATVTKGTATGSTLPLTVTGLDAGTSATVTVTVTRTNYATGSATQSGNALEAGLTPTFGSVTQTENGFTVDITNYDDNYTFTPITDAGTVTAGTADGTNLPLTITGLNPGQPATVSVTTTRTDYNFATATVSDFALPFTPTFSSLVRTADGFTVNVDNYDSNYTFTATVSPDTATVTKGTATGSTLPLTVTGLDAGTSATVTVTVTRTNYATGSATQSGNALEAGLTPTFGSVTQTENGFTVDITNYDDNYTFTPITDAGTVTAGTADGTNLPLTITGLNPGQPATVSVTTTRTDYNFATATVSDFALPFTPTFSSLVRTADGFTVNVDNYDSNYTFTATVSPDTATVTKGTASGTTLPLTVTGLDAGTSATVTVTVTRTNYATGSATQSGNALEAGLTPTFGSVTQTENGFTVDITNYDDNYTFTPITDAGTVTAGTADGTNLPLTITGLNPGQPATVSVTTTRTDYNFATATVSDFALPFTPTFSSLVRTADGFTVNVDNYDSNYTFTATVSPDTATVTKGTATGSTLPLTVTGLNSGQSATVTVTVTRTNYETGNSTLTANALPLVPTFDDPVFTSDGFTINVTNFNSNYTFTPSVSPGSVDAGTTSGSILPLTITGLDSEQPVELSVTTQGPEISYDSGTGTPGDITFYTQIAPEPTFSSPVPTASGFTVNVTSYDPDFTYTPSVDTGSVEKGAVFNDGDQDVLPLIISGLNPGQPAKVTVLVSGENFNPVNKFVSGFASPIKPTFSFPVRTIDGFTVNVTNFTSDYTFTPTISSGPLNAQVAAGEVFTENGVKFLPLTVTGLNIAESATIEVSVTKTGYATGSDTVIASSFEAGLVPTFGSVTQTENGFTVDITNYDDNYTFTPITDAGTVTAGTADGTNLPLTITGLNPGQPATVSVTTTRTDYNFATATVSDFALPFTPTFSSLVRTADGFTVNVDNYDSNYTFTATVSPDTATVTKGTASGTTLPLTVTGLDAGTSATVTVTVTRTNYATGSATQSGNALEAGLTPTFGSVTQTENGFTVDITNYDDNYTFTPITDAGTVTAGTADGTNLPLTITGLNPGQPATVSVTTTRTDYNFATATVSDFALPFTPTFSSLVRTADGFTVNVDNYDSNYTFTATVSPDTATVTKGTASGTTLPLTVTGLDAGTSATVTVTVTRTNYATGSATQSGNALEAGLTPTFGSVTQTENGFTVDITNYDDNYTFTPITDAGTVTAGTADGTNLPLTITGLNPGQPATVSVTTTRTDYNFATATVSDFALPFTPTFSSLVRTADGFTVNVDNYDSNYTFTATVSPDTATVTKGTATGSTLPLTVTGLDAGTSATVTVTVTRTNYATGSATQSGNALEAGLTPTFGSVTQIPAGFTFNITNYDSNYTFIATTSAGTVTKGSAFGSVMPLIVTGLNPGQPAIVTITTARTDHVNGSATLTAYADPLTPTFSTLVRTADGYTVNVTNYNSNYTFTATVSPDTATVTKGTASGSTLPLTVTGINSGESATVTVTVTRTNYETGSATVSGTALLAVLTPTLDTPSSTSTGYTVNVTNYDANYTFTATTTAGTVTKGTASGATLPLTVTGLNLGQAATVTVTVTRTDYATGTASVTANATSLRPTFSTPVRTSAGYTVNVTNYNSNYTFTAESSAGTVTKGTASGATLPLTVTGLASGISATVTVTVTRTNYATGSSTVSGTALEVALTPTFGASTQTADGFTLQISNYDAAYTWAGTNSLSGTVSINGTGLITVTGLNPGASSTVTITTTRTGYVTGSATSSSVASITGTALTPTFSTPVSTADGFTVNVTNYSASFTYTQATTSGTITRGTISGSTMPLTVTGLNPGQFATVTVNTTRTGYASGTATDTGSAAPLVPTFNTPSSTAVGFVVNVTNYKTNNANYTFTPTTSAGTLASTALANGDLQITITALAPGASATVTVTTTRLNYVTGSATVTGKAINGAALTPTLSTPVRTADGFTVNVTNYNANYTFTPSTIAGTVTEGTASGSTLPLTLTGLNPGQAATVTVTVTRTGYDTGTGAASSNALSLTPTFSTPVSTADGFTVNVTNYDANYTFTTTSSAGTITRGTAVGATLPLTITGINAGQATTITVTTVRTNYTTGSATVTANATSLAPTFSIPVRTSTGYTLNVTNYNANYTFTPSTNAGTVTAGAVSGSTLPLTVTGLNPGQFATVTVTTTRTSYTSGTANVSAYASSLTSNFSTPVRTADGFTVNVTNYNAAYTFTPSTTAGTLTQGTASGSTLPLTITGLTYGQAATITVTVTRTDYDTGTGTVSSNALSLTPTFSTPVSTTDGYTVNVTNYDANYAFTPTISAGSVTEGTATGSTLPLTITGLAPGASATLTVGTTRASYSSGTATVTGKAINGAALNPTFGSVTQTETGFTFNVTNYDANYTFTPTTTAGSASAGSPDGINLPVTVTGLNSGQPATITVTVTRTGYDNGTATKSGFALPLTPTFSTPVRTADGFTVNVTNYNANYTFTATISPDTATVTKGSASGTILPLTVTGLNAGQRGTVTVTVTRTDYETGSATVIEKALPLVPTFDSPVFTADGFTINVTNYNANYTFTPSISPDTATVTKGTASGTTLPLTITGLTSDQLVALSVTTQGPEATYDSGTGTTGEINFYTQNAIEPTFGSVTQTADGYTVNVTNYDGNYTFTPTTTAGTVTEGTVVGTTLPLTVSGLSYGQPATVTVTVSGSSINPVSKSVSSYAQPLTPTFSTPVRTSTGYTVNVTNYNANYTFTPTTTAGTVTAGTASGSTLPLTVAALSAGAPATVTVTVTRTNYETGSATVSGNALDAALTPAFGSVTQTADGYTVNVTNYDANYTFTPTTTAGTVTAGTANGATLPLTVTGLSHGQPATVTVTVTRTGYVTGSATVSGYAQPLTPTFSTPVRTSTGYTVNVTNYNANYTFTPTTTAGTVTAGTASGSTLPLTVAALSAGAPATVTVTVTRTNYETGSATVSGNALDAALTPAFGSVTQTADGYTVNVTNYDANYTFTPTTTSGTVTAGTASGATLPLTVTGLSHGQPATVTVTVTRTGYVTGSATVSGYALPLTPTFSTPVRTSTGYTVNVTNYNSNYTFTPTTTAGSVTAGTASGATLPLTVAGLSAGAAATVTVTVTRTNYETGSATVSGNALNSALTPTFGASTQTADGFTLPISNYDAAFTWSGTNSLSGTVTISGTGLITVTALNPGASSTVTITTTRTGYVTGSATSTSVASITGTALTPTFSTPVQTSTGFTVNVTNYNSNFTFTPTTTVGTATAGTATGSTLPLTVTGLNLGQPATVTVTTTRTGYYQGSATVSSSALSLTPTFSTPVSTADGYTVDVTNFDANYTFSATTSAGTVNAGLMVKVAGKDNWRFTVTTLLPGAQATLTVNSTRIGHNSGSATVTGKATNGTALTPTFSTPVRTADGFTVNVNNYNASYTFTPTTTAGTVTAGTASGATLPLTVTGLNSGQPATVTVTVARTGYDNGTATVSSNALSITPTYSAPISTADGFTVNVTNYDANYTFTPTTTAGTVTAGTASGAILPLTVSGLNPGQVATVTVTVTRTSYSSGSATVTGSAISLTPTFSTPVRTNDGFTVDVTNYDTNYTFTPTTSAGTVTAGTANGTTLPLTITGLSAGASATLTVTITRTSYGSGSATVTESALNAALTPIFDGYAATADGFTAEIINYDSAFTWSGTSSVGGTVSISDTGSVVVTGVNAGTSSKITVTTTRTGYVSGSATSASIASMIGTALTPTFGSPIATADGFTVEVTNYDANFSFTATTSAGTVSPTTLSAGNVTLTVTGLANLQSAVITVATSRTGYYSGTASVTGTALNAALTPTFSTPVSTTTGFTVNVTNYNANYTFTPTITAGTITRGTVSGATLPLTISGLTTGQLATLTVTTTRTGYAVGTATVDGSAIKGAALVPTFSTPVRTVDGFTVNVTNYNSLYTFTPTASAGTATAGVASGTTLPLTITGLTTGQSATVTVLVIRTGYNNGSGTVTGTANAAALDPVFSTPVSTSTGFTVNVTNYNSLYTYTPTVSSGTVTKGTVSGTNLPLTIAGLAPGASATVTMSVTRVGYNNGTGTVSGVALTGAALNSTFTVPVSISTGYTVNVSNYNALYTYAVSTTAGTVTKGTASGTTLPLLVTGLTTGQAATVTVTTTRTGYNNGTGNVTGNATSAALVSTFSTPVQTATGFTVNVNNYNALFTYTTTTSVGTLTRGTASGTTLPLTITGLTPGQSATVTVTTARTGYASGTATVTGAAITGAALNPTFSVPVSTADGFTVNVTNYNSLYTYIATTSAGTVTKGTVNTTTLPLTVTGLAAGESATVTVTVSRTGYNDGSATVTGAAGAVLTPTFSTPVATATGFTVNVTNYNASYTFNTSITAGTVTKGTVSGTTLPLTIAGLTTGQTATVTVDTTRTGFISGSATVDGIAAGALTPTFSTPVRTSTGFTVNVTNYSASYTFTATVSTGTVTKGTVSGTTLPLTIAGVSPGASATVTVTTTRTGFETGTGTVTSTALNGTALTPTFSTPVSTIDGFTVNVTNYNAAYVFAATTSAGTVIVGTAVSATLPLTVTGLTTGQSVTVTVTTTRTGYNDGTASRVGSSNAAGLTPTFSTPVQTSTGYTVNVTNYSSLYTYTPTVSSGTVTKGTVSGTNLPLTIGGLTPGASANVTMNVTRTGYNAASGTVTGSALNGAALTSTFSVPVSNSSGFTVNVSNYNSLYTYTATSSAGTVTKGTASGTTLPLLVTGLSTGQSATVTVTTTRTGYNTGTGSVTGSSNAAALIPTFSTPVATSTGFTVNVTNYNSAYTFTTTTSPGTLTRGTISGTTLPLTISGLTLGQSATVTVTTARTGYNSGTATIVGTATAVAPATGGAALISTFSVPVSNATGFTANVTNYNSLYTYEISSSAGTVTFGTASSTTRPLTVTGLSTGQSALVTVTTTRAGYNTGTGTVTGYSNFAALTPTFSTPVSTSTGFTVNVINYNSTYTFTVTTSAGTVTKGTAIGSTLPLTISGLTAGATATVTVTTTRTGYNNGVSTLLGTAGEALAPTFSMPISTTSGFTVDITNYNSLYTFTVTTSAGTVTKGSASGSTLPLTITGLSAGQTATVTVTVTRSGFKTGTATITASASDVVLALGKNSNFSVISSFTVTAISSKDSYNLVSV